MANNAQHPPFEDIFRDLHMMIYEAERADTIDANRWPPCPEVNIRINDQPYFDAAEILKLSKQMLYSMLDVLQHTRAKSRRRKPFVLETLDKDHDAEMTKRIGYGLIAILTHISRNQPQAHH